MDTDVVTCDVCHGTGECIYGCVDRDGRTHDCEVCGGTGTE